MRKTTSGKIAFCGIMGGIIMLLMLSGNIIPIATYAVPCLASILMMIVMEECGEKSAWTLYAAVTILSLIIIADKELMLFYALIMGFYPMLKKHIEQLNSKALKLILKLLIFNAALAAIYLLLLVVFPITELAAEFAELGTVMNIILIIIGNVIFFMLDIVINKMRILYINKLRPKLIKSTRS